MTTESVTRFYVYAVIDPDSGNPIYIGQTNNPERRYERHKTNACSKTKLQKPPFHLWLRDHLVNGRNPELRILMIVDTREQSEWAEYDMINAFIHGGVKLLNANHAVWKYSHERAKELRRIRHG